MHAEDLAPFVYYDLGEIPEILTVGWINPDHAFSKGEVSPGFLAKLQSLVLDWKEGQILINRRRAGREKCPFCEKDGYGIIDDDHNVSLENVELWFPGKNGIFYHSPAYILHYIIDHQYRPPQEFINAVLEFTPTPEVNGQEEYYALINKFN